MPSRTSATSPLALALAFVVVLGLATAGAVGEAMATYQNDAVGFRVDHPASWQTLDGGLERTSVDLFDESGLGFATVAVYPTSDLPSTDPATLLELLFDGHVMFVEVLETRDGDAIDLGGVAGVVRHFDGVSTQGAGAPQTGSVYVASTDELLIVISVQANADHIQAYRPAFDAIVASFALAP
ncbi:MAG: hypothetical protein EA416_03535 [Trueperaceae bacterium]|nr:MAG: hypothetical protein EA416_03535 [Trueperaceae bacterium]